MKMLLVTATVFVSLLAILIPLDKQDQRSREADRAEFDRQVAAYEAGLSRGENPALTAPKYPTSAEVAAYWKARGGYGSQRADGSNNNRHRERIWFSPGCLDPDKGQLSLI